jgi:hypothetical protein
VSRVNGSRPFDRPFERSPAARRGPRSSGHLLPGQLTLGNDTDSFGATAGSLLGAYFGPGYLEKRWLAPFNDDIHTAPARFYERSLSGLSRRMGELPQRVAAEIMYLRVGRPA